MILKQLWGETSDSLVNLMGAEQVSREAARERILQPALSEAEGA